MGGITANNYTQLQLDIQDWTIRNNLGSIIQRVIYFGQRKLEDILLVEGIGLPLVETSFNYTPYLAINTNSIPVPSDYLQLIYLQLTDQLPSPVITLSSTTGTLAAGTYYYRITATNVNGETLGSDEKSITLSSTGGVKLDWAAVTNATGYKVYGRATGAELYIATISSGSTITYTDSGSITPSGILLSQNTTGTEKYEIIEKISPIKFADIEFTSINAGNKDRPYYCTRLGSNFIFDIYAGKDYAYDLRYYKRISDLSTSSQTNYWTDNHYMALLYSSLGELIPYVGDDPRGQMWMAKRDEEIALIRKRNYFERFRGNRNKTRTRNSYIV